MSSYLSSYSLVSKSIGATAAFALWEVGTIVVPQISHQEPFTC